MKLIAPSFWKRMAEVRLFTWGYLAFHIFFMVSMRLFLNYNIVISTLGFWMGVVVLEHVLIFSYLGIARRFIRNYTNRFVIFSALIIGAIRTYITTTMQIVAIPDTVHVNWTLQLITGALFELLIVTLWANINGAYRNYSTIARELRSTKSSILGYRENAEFLLAEEQESLERLTRDSLLPQIYSIESSLAGKANLAESMAIAAELKGFLNNQVRPLTAALRTAANRLVMPTRAERNAFWAVVQLPKRSRLTNSIFPETTFFIMLLSYIAAPLWLLDASWVPVNTVMSVTFLLVLLGAKRISKSWPPLPTAITSILVIATSVLAVIPTFAVIVWAHPGSQSALVLSAALLWCSSICMGMLAYLDSLDYQANKFLDELQEENQLLGREMAVFEQQLWAARRNWSIIIHGTVQAALTAALTRLNAPNIDEETITLAKQDLQRAVDALNTPPSTSVNLPVAIEELVGTWRGVCDIEISVAPRLLESVAADGRTSMCVNEILKEAVSNAVRHGDANQISVKLAEAGESELELNVWNNGAKYVAGGRKGLGSTMMDDLTIAWNIGTDAKTEQTLLSARLPFSSVPA